MLPTIEYFAEPEMFDTATHESPEDFLSRLEEELIDGTLTEDEAIMIITDFNNRGN